jgi:hypothetical protein
MRVGLVIASALVLSIASCEAFTHSNPYDPQTKFEYSILGPDTLFSLGQVASYEIQSKPALADTAGIWSCDCLELVSQAGTRTFSVSGLVAPPQWPATTTVRLDVLIGKFDTIVFHNSPSGPFPVLESRYQRTLSRTVVVTQR